MRYAGGTEYRRADLPAPVKVKDLVWRDSYGVQRAETMFGDYLVTGKILTLPTALRPQMVLDTPEAAKAAAQSDYTARILAALEPAPPDPRVAALVDRLGECLAGLSHRDVSQSARDKIRKVVDAAIKAAKGADT